MIRKVLIANRGEIAVRIMRTAKARGVATVAVYSDSDAGACHVRCADEAVWIGASEAAQSYLNIGAIIEAAERAGADAIHPGYGFLSERADFAAACEDAGLVFIGPTAEAIAAMGDKAEAKPRMIAAGVACVPGYHGVDQSDERLIDEVQRIGFPAMLKAAAGGGGRGMRLVHRADQLEEAIASARRESASAFGDGRLLVEKAIVGARHVEIQLIADAFGNCIHLGERDCSLQRRRQKVIEEAPSPALTPDLRNRMGEAAVAAARAVGYQSAGTVEFLFDPETKDFYFLEMNTRLQVEHPVTEMTTGLDLVALQFDVAEGKSLPLRQEDVRHRGAAIEARLYAEDPAKGFLPQSGEILLWRAPQGQGVRVDAGVETGDKVSTFYDPILAKIIAHGDTREEARRRLIAALRETILLGVGSNRDFLIALLEDDAFAGGKAATDYIDENLVRLTKSASPADEALAVVAMALVDEPFGALLTGWNSRGRCSFPLRLEADGAIIVAEASISGNRIEVRAAGGHCAIEGVEKSANKIQYISNGGTDRAFYARSREAIEIDFGGVMRRYTDISFARTAEATVGEDNVKAPMAGVVTSISVKVGDPVSKGQTVAAVEAMKMEHHLKAPRDGRVAEVLAKPGDQIAIRSKIVVLAGKE